MTVEEQEIYEKIKDIKNENELLTKIYEEINSLIKTGYDGPFMGEDVREIFKAVNQYNIWKKERVTK